MGCSGHPDVELGEFGVGWEMLVTIVVTFGGENLAVGDLCSHIEGEMGLGWGS